MKRIPRFFDNLLEFTRNDKVLVIYGPKQVGKTTLVRRLIDLPDTRVRYDTGDDFRIRELWSSQNPDSLKDYVDGYDIVVIDEAQRIPNIGIGLKLLIDEGTPCRLVVTGSSSFELAGQIGEPLTGRKRTLKLYPVAQLELKKEQSAFDLKKGLDNFLLYGTYPEVLTTKNTREKVDLLNEYIGSYLLKDILEFDRVKNSRVLFDLLKLLAFQVGNEVSLRELGGNLGLDYKTVARYLDLLEKSFIILQIRGYSGNLRKEVTKKSRYYFFDNGIRNALIANFTAPDTRDDIGALWENFLVLERIKKNSYHSIYGNHYFWRTWDQQEIDYIEERDGELYGYEFKYGKKTPSAPSAWRGTYPTAKYRVVNRDNYQDFVL